MRAELVSDFVCPLKVGAHLGVAALLGKLDDLQLGQRLLTRRAAAAVTATPTSALASTAIVTVAAATFPTPATAAREKVIIVGKATTSAIVGRASTSATIRISSATVIAITSSTAAAVAVPIAAATVNAAAAAATVAVPVAVRVAVITTRIGSAVAVGVVAVAIAHWHDLFAQNLACVNLKRDHTHSVNPFFFAHRETRERTNYSTVTLN
jgi:hypothetical protein